MSFPILFRSSSSFGQRWKAELERHIPDLDFRVYPEIGGVERNAALLRLRIPHRSEERGAH